MKLRLARKIMFGRFSDRYSGAQISRALRRWDRSAEAKEADRLWNELASAWRDELFRPLTPEEAQKAYDEAVPLSEERIQEIFDYATRGG